ILADNLGGGALDFREDGQVTSAQNSLVEDPTGNSLVNGVDGNIVGVAPMLGALADNGGPTQTQALLAGRPALDKGLEGPGVPSTDQRGLPRPSGTGVDIGAYELEQDNPPVANDDSYTANENSTLTVDALNGVLANDTDPDGDSLQAVFVSGPA